MAGDLEWLGEQIAEQVAHLDAATRGLLVNLRTFDEGDGWEAQGARSCAHWLSWRVGWGPGTAREHLRVAHALAKLPRIDEELAHGRLSYSKVRAITRVATPENETTLLEQAKLATASQLETICRKYATVRRQDPIANPQDDRDRRCVKRMDLADGMVRITAILHPDEAATVWAAMEHAAKQRRRVESAQREPGPAQTREHASAEVRRDPACSAAGGDVPAEPRGDVPAETCRDVPAGTRGDVPAEPRGDVPAEMRGDVPAEPPRANVSAEPRRDVSAEPPQNLRPSAAHRVPARPAFDRADGLVALAQIYLRGDAPERAPVELVVSVSHEALQRGLGADAAEVACTRDGTCMSPQAARRLACDAGIVVLVEDAHGNPLSVGRKTRVVSGSLKRALLARDQHCCRFPGCTNQVYLESHHIEHWANGGETELRNMVSLCSFHHHFLHEYEFTVELGADGSVVFRDDGGRIVPDAPPPANPPMLGWEAIHARNARRGITAATNEPEWDGYPADYAACIDELVVADGLT